MGDAVSDTAGAVQDGPASPDRSAQCRGAAEAGVEPALLQKLPLRPGLGDAVLGQDHDAVRVPHGGEPVRGPQRGASHAEGAEGGLYPRLGPVQCDAPLPSTVP